MSLISDCSFVPSVQHSFTEAAQATTSEDRNAFSRHRHSIIWQMR